MIICLHWWEENRDVVDRNCPSYPPVLQNLLEASHSERGFQERWLMPKACQYSRGIWLTPTVTGFNFWLALKRSGSCMDDLWRSLWTGLFSSVHEEAVTSVLSLECPPLPVSWQCFSTWVRISGPRQPKNYRVSEKWRGHAVKFTEAPDYSYFKCLHRAGICLLTLHRIAQRTLSCSSGQQNVISQIWLSPFTSQSKKK